MVSLLLNNEVAAQMTPMDFTTGIHTLLVVPDSDKINKNCLSAWDRMDLKGEVTFSRFVKNVGEAKLVLGELLNCDPATIAHDIPLEPGITHQQDFVIGYRGWPLLIKNGSYEGEVIYGTFKFREGKPIWTYKPITRYVRWPLTHEYLRKAAFRCLYDRLAKTMNINDAKKYVTLEVPTETIDVLPVDVATEPLLHVTRLHRGSESIEIAHPDSVTACEKVLKKLRGQAAREDWPKLVPPHVDAVEIRNFQQTLASYCGPPKGFGRPWITTEEDESITVVIVRVAREIRVPKNLVGKVRGKANRSINRMAARHNYSRIQIIEV